MRNAAIVLITMISTACFGMPKWAVNSYMKDGNTVLMVCIGKGPSLDHARLEATDNCISSVSREFTATSDINTFSMETLENSYLQHTVQTKASIKDLKCQVVNEEYEENDGHFAVYRKCKFDLTLAKDRKEEVPERSFVNNSDGTQLYREDEAELKPRNVIQDAKILNVVSVPKCDLVIVYPSMKSIPCKENPQVVSVPVTSEKVEVRKSGYIQKTIQLKKDEKNETISVILDSI